jgi:5'-nucleotidase
VAVSLEFDEHARFDKAARLAREIIEQVLQEKGPEPQLYNLNIPTAALSGTPEIDVAPMSVTRYGDSFEKRIDPWGRDYYWLIGGPAADTPGRETDLSALAKGKVTITPLDYDLTRQTALAEMERWPFRLSEIAVEHPSDTPGETSSPTVRTQPRKLQKEVGNAR